VGAVVNLAARIESLTTGGQVLISGELRDAVASPLELTGERTFEPKGAAAPLTVFEVRALGGAHDLRLRSEAPPLREIAPLAIGVSAVSDVSTGPRLPATLVAVAADRIVVREVPEALSGDVRLYLPAAPDAAVYGKVVAAEGDALTVAYTAVSAAIVEELERHVR
ncbi:MAG: hypothetical protein AAGH15_27695, partial [Myxococcota bacterium]